MLPLHVGGDLDPRHVVAVDNHLKHCLSCFREFREFASMRTWLGVLAEERLPEGVLDGFAEEVMARIQVGEPGPAAAAPGPAVIRWPVLPRLAAAAAVLIVCVAGWRYMSDGALPRVDRPLTSNSLPPSNVVGQEQEQERALAAAQRSTSVPIPYGASRMPRGSSLSMVPPGLQGLQLLSQEELSLLQRAPHAGVILLFPRGSGGDLQVVDECVEAPELPRVRER